MPCGPWSLSHPDRSATIESIIFDMYNSSFPYCVCLITSGHESGATEVSLLIGTTYWCGGVRWGRVHDLLGVSLIDTSRLVGAELKLEWQLWLHQRWYNSSSKWLTPHDSEKNICN